MVNKKNIIPWKFIFLLFLGLRLWTLSAFFGAQNYLQFEPRYPYTRELLLLFKYPILWSWASFDGVHYLSLAEKGYSFLYSQAFFPVYFLFIRFVNFFIHNYLLSGLLISHLGFILSLVMFYKLIRLDFDEKVARWSMLFMTFFPSSFYFLSVYTESLYLFLT
ncbi:hypothetical protein GYA19_00830, partial [Candidatus Beckwithbacteria bacterium]|nr:hypothetical protein [Candidatus Beckwithbacteria bacterium]